MKKIATCNFMFILLKTTSEFGERAINWRIKSISEMVFKII